MLGLARGDHPNEYRTAKHPRKTEAANRRKARIYIGGRRGGTVVDRRRRMDDSAFRHPQLKSTFEAGEAQRFAKLGQVEGVIRTIQDKIETLTGANGKLRMLEDKLDSATGKFLQVEAAIKLNSDGIARNNIRLDMLEEELSRGIGEPRRRTSASKRPMDDTREARERR